LIAFEGLALVLKANKPSIAHAGLLSNCAGRLTDRLSDSAHPWPVLKSGQLVFIPVERLAGQRLTIRL